jgi:hypothetical protein
MLVWLAPHVDVPLLDELVRIALEKPMYTLKDEIEAVAGRLDSEGLRALLGRIQRMPERYHRRRALTGIAPKLSADELAKAVAWGAGLDVFEATSIVSALSPYLPPAQAIQLAATHRGELRAAVLRPLASTLPRELLPDAVELVAQISDEAERGDVLAEYLPRLRQEGLAGTVADAYKITFLIGDEARRAVAQAALLRHLGGRAPIAEADGVGRMSPALPVAERFAWCLAVALRSPSLRDAESINRAVTAARDIEEPEFRSAALAALALRAPGDEGDRLRDEAAQGAPMPVRVILAISRPSDTVAHTLSEERKRLEGAPPSEDRDDALAAVRLASALTAPIPISESLKEIEETMGTPGEGHLRLVAAAWRLILGRKLSSPDLDDLIRTILEHPMPVEEPAEERLFWHAALAAYLPDEALWPVLRTFLEAGTRVPRPTLLMGLAMAQGIVNDLAAQNAQLGENRIPGSPFERLGERAALDESLEAIRDVGAWWP